MIGREGIVLGDFVVDPVLGGVIGVACLVGIVLTAWRGGRRRALRIALQLVAAGLLLAALSVRDAARPATLLVIAEGATVADVEAAVRADSSVTVVALPGAATSSGLDCAPEHDGACAEAGDVTRNELNRDERGGSSANASGTASADSNREIRDAATAETRNGARAAQSTNEWPTTIAGRTIERVPDLATALRRFDAQALIVVGDGLRAHDRAAVAGRALMFAPPAARDDAAAIVDIEVPDVVAALVDIEAPNVVAAIVAIEAPEVVVAGTWWRVTGRVEGAALLGSGGGAAGASGTATADEARNGNAATSAQAQATAAADASASAARRNDANGAAETPPGDAAQSDSSTSQDPATAPALVALLDPAGTEVAKAPLARDGRFALQAVARAAGAFDFELQLRRGDTVVQTVPLPLRADASPPVRALLLAAAPSPELKYLRRWALDAGVPLEARIALAPGLAQRRGAVALDAAQLAQLDLLIVDERSWPQLATLQPALREAVRGGLGLLVRVTGPVPEAVAREWATWGLPVPNAATPREVLLDEPAPAAADPTEPARLLHAWPVANEAPAGRAPVLLADREGTPLADWHALGRGRVGSWRLADSHRLYTRGQRERHATLWSSAWTALARARGLPAPVLPKQAIAGERAVVCGIDNSVSVGAPSGAAIALAVVDGCAAFWPREAGWHRLAGVEGETRFAVRDPAAVRPLLRAAQRAATQALVRPAPAREPASPADPDRRRAGWLAAWLAVAAALWWLERRP